MKQTVKRALAILALGMAFGIGWGSAVVGVGAQGTQPSRVAFVDVQRILARSAAGVAAREQLERERLDVAVDPSRIGPGVRGDEADPHGVGRAYLAGTMESAHGS